MKTCVAFFCAFALGLASLHSAQAQKKACEDSGTEARIFGSAGGRQFLRIKSEKPDPKNPRPFSFSICTIQLSKPSGASDCKAIGNADRYSREEVDALLKRLKEEAKAVTAEQKKAASSASTAQFVGSLFSSAAQTGADVAGANVTSVSIRSGGASASDLAKRSLNLKGALVSLKKRDCGAFDVDGDVPTMAEIIASGLAHVRGGTAAAPDHR